MKSTNTSDRFRPGNSRCAVPRRIRGAGRSAFRTRPIAIGLACLIFWAGATSICAAQESQKKKKASSDPDPGLGKLSQQINDPDAYMRELAGRLNSSGGQNLLTRGMPNDRSRPSTAPAPSSAPAAAETPADGTASRGLSPAPTQTRFGWSPGDEDAALTQTRFGWRPGTQGSSASASGGLSQLESRMGTTSQTWMSPSDRARQVDPLSASRDTQASQAVQPAPAEPARSPQGWMAPNERSLPPASDGARPLGEGTSETTIDTRTWMAPQDRMSQPSLDNVRLLRPSAPSARREPWQYARPSQPQQNQMTQTAPRETAAPAQNPYAAQTAPQQWPPATSQPWQAPQNQMTQAAPRETAAPAQNPYAAQTAPQQWPAATSRPWQAPQSQMTQTAPSETAAPAQNPYAAQAAPQWPTATTGTGGPSPDDRAAQMAMGELETIYPTGQTPRSEPAPAIPTNPVTATPAWQTIAPDPRITASDVQVQTPPAQSQTDLTQNWLSPKNRAAQAAMNEMGEMATVDEPQNARVTPTTVPGMPVVRSEVGPGPGSQAARTVVNGSQARHFYEEKEPAWSLGADLDKYRAHAVKEGSRNSGDSLKNALGGIGLAVEDTTNIITLGYASDRAKPLRSNDGKGFFDEPGRVPKQAGATIGSLGDGLYSVADLVTFNALPDSQKDVYLDNHPIVRPLIFTGRTIGGAWKTTEEIGNALTWGYFDNVTGSIGMCIESLIEALKHTGQAVTNLARIPVRLIAGNNEKTDKALDWVLLVPLEMASNVVEMKGISNMDDYEAAFADKGVVGSILEFGGSTFIVYRAVDEMIDELKKDDNGSRSGGGSSNPSNPDFPAPIADPPYGPGTVFWFENGWPTGPVN